MDDEQVLAIEPPLPFSDPPLTDEEADALLAAEMGEGEEEGEEG
ncbi:MAG: hypothetical protein WC977_14060 [Anaerovoracaceae bacterium]